MDSENFNFGLHQMNNDSIDLLNKFESIPKNKETHIAGYPADGCSHSFKKMIATSVSHSSNGIRFLTKKISLL